MSPRRKRAFVEKYALVKIQSVQDILGDMSLKIVRLTKERERIEEATSRLNKYSLCSTINLIIYSRGPDSSWQVGEGVVNVVVVGRSDMLLEEDRRVIVQPAYYIHKYILSIVTRSFYLVSRKHYNTTKHAGYLEKNASSTPPYHRGRIHSSFQWYSEWWSRERKTTIESRSCGAEIRSLNSSSRYILP